jgi:hypothetical protein
VTLFQCFFSTASGYGTITLDGRRLGIKMIEGELTIEKLFFSDAESTRAIDWKVTARPGPSVFTTV